MDLYKVFKALMFQLSPETAHDVVTSILEGIQNSPVQKILKNKYAVNDSRLEIDLLNNTFENPVGLAAGFDKSGSIPTIMSALGFGFVEIGGVTAQAQDGNSRPRLFRLRKDNALINRMGFNNPGAGAVARRLNEIRLPDSPMGINIGKSKDVSLDNATQDYLQTYEQLERFGDFFVVNVSSPNTPGLRTLQNRGPLEKILRSLKEQEASPLLVKVSPDLQKAALLEILEVVEDCNIDGIIATNTTISRPDSLGSSNQSEKGGLSGKPLKAKSTKVISFLYERTSIPIIGVGGISTAEDAYRKIKAGACLVQLYTALIYEGPGIARSINRGLLTHLNRDGFDHIKEAIGVEANG